MYVIVNIYAAVYVAVVVYVSVTWMWMQM